MANLTIEQKALFDALHQSRKDDFKTFNKKSYRGVWGSIIDKYPESAHFIYELLQNADDAEATDVYIILKKDCLFFKHNGKKHFDITRDEADPVGDINSITGIGDSSKVDVHNKIGKFGVGFKAVFQYTDTPEIYDDVFKFKIDNYIIPSLLTHDHPERKEGETLFVFPFKNITKSYNDIKNRLESLQNPILFLRNLQQIKWRVDNNSNQEGELTVYSKELLETIDFEKEGILLERYLLNEISTAQEIFLFSKSITIKDESNKLVKHIISVGFYYDSSNHKLITDKRQNIYCFFPTKETFNTCFISHAPFLLTDNRQNLKPNEKLNETLVNSLAKLAAKAIVLLRDYGLKRGHYLINENLTEIIPKYQPNYWTGLNKLFEQPVENAFSDLVENERIFLSRRGKYISMKEAFIGTPRELVDLLNQKQLIFLNTENLTDYYDEDDTGFKIGNIDFLKWELAQNISKQDNSHYEDIRLFTSNNFASLITEKFMEAQDIKLVTRMYTFLRTAAPKLWKITEKEKKKAKNDLPFRNAPIIKTQKGKWVAPFVDTTTPNVYFPIKGQDYNESDYNFIAIDYLKNDMAKKFFSELEIKEPEEEDYIRHVVLSKYNNSYDGINFDVIRTDFEILLDFYIKNRDIKSRGEQYIRLLRENILIIGDNYKLYKPDNLYFKNELLKKYYTNNKDIKFLNIDFYAPVIKKYNENVVVDFFTSIGVKRHPQIEHIGGRTIWTLNNRIKSQISTDNISEYFIDDYELNGFKEFCDGKFVSREVSLFLWNEVLPSIKFSEFECLKFTYRRKYARSYDYTFYTSTFKDELQNYRWLINKEGKVVSAQKIALEDLDSGYNRNNGLVQFLGIEKREKSIIELGGTEEQQEQMDLGKRIKSFVGDSFSEEELIQVLLEAKAKKNSRPIPTKGHDGIEGGNGKPTPTRPSPDKNKVSSGGSKEPKPDTNNQNNEEENQTAYVNRKELRKTGFSEMFINNCSGHPSKTEVIVDEEETSSEEEIDSIMQKLIEQEERQDKIKALRETASKAEKYSKEWFDALIELEYRGGKEEDKGDATKAINISFASVRKELGSERIYVFGRPSRGIPMWLEEVGDMEVKCTFSNRDELKIKFEVANVRDSNLRLKASKIYEPILNKIDWSHCTKASITLKNQIDLMGKLRIAFNSLELPSGYNLKENLSNNIKFIFGPPGTGKTTTIAKKIISFMRSEDTCRILVLTPTNTACDELARKIKEISQNDCFWLYRFVSTADEALEDIVIDRDSAAYNEDKCCIISTIARLSFDGFNGDRGFYKLLDLVWDIVICDEASMIPLAEMALAIYNYLNTPILIAGDPMQIKPILREKEWKDENIYSMVNLNRFDSPVTEPIQFEIENLNTQYRSVPTIGELFSQYAYDGKLEHHRSALPNKMFGKIEMKPVNFISFKVEKYDSIFGIKKLDGSNVHIYSVLFTVELLKYVTKEYAKMTDDVYSIGIVCPYSPQAQLIESLIAQTPNIPPNINITVGTVHRFQGGQCNMMFVVLNPPLGIKVASERIFLNNKNILNVAISRAQDYLCILLPHRDTEGYEYLYEINTIGRIAMQRPEQMALYTCDEIEEYIFGHKFYIESNTFVTSHQLTNVYSKAVKKYEVRIDEKSVDIQLGNSTTYKTTYSGTNPVTNPDDENG